VQRRQTSAVALAADACQADLDSMVRSSAGAWAANLDRELSAHADAA
jgi:hypothetical protein